LIIINGIRDALRGGELIKDATKLYSGSEDEQGIHQVIEQAKDFLYIVSPYFSAGENHLRAIIKAKGRDVKTVLLVRKDGLQKYSISELKKLE
jgi:phosphatidylserine/phosphatidylglycerophosphate/cardiolipin synthase-like enzyme